MVPRKLSPFWIFFLDTRIIIITMSWITDFWDRFRDVARRHFPTTIYHNKMNNRTLKTLKTEQRPTENCMRGERKEVTM